ncbi:MAG TPA: DUF3293 domain-containing protein [Burkholderiales bacterium]|nr:DUF3293 domain-containing protein [Burkholderiales bacterium]
MPLPTELLEAYRKTDYAVFGKPELVLRIGERSADLDELLEAEGAQTAAFITAANPGGRARGAWPNEVANAALVEALNKAGVRCFEGEGRARDRKWVEKSVLAVGISRDDAEKAGRAFGQNAIVFVERGRAPELVPL